MTTDTNLSQIVFNRLSNEKYHELKTSGQLNDQQFYITPDLDTNPGLIQDYMSNCITKIPQHIKLELNDGTLTLKAGSIAYVPNGFEEDGLTKKFDKINTNNDIIFTQLSNQGVNFIYLDNLGTALSRHLYMASGTVIPAEFTGTFYNTETNQIYYCNAGIGTPNGSFSFPIAIVTINENNTAKVASINQVFNGIGYIGAVAFAVPGVQAIIPNGFNNNGQLNNYTATVERVLLKDYAADGLLGHSLALTLTNSPLLSAGNMIYVEEENQMYKDSISELNKRAEVEIAKITTDSTRITSLTPLPVYNRILSSSQVYDFGNDLLEKNITNCLTKIPQDIKLELNDGTLTLKAGSKVYDGAGNPINITTDIKQSVALAQVFIGFVYNGNSFIWESLDRCFSGDTYTGSVSGNAIWYDTANKIVKRTTDGGSSWLSGTVSLPFVIITGNGTNVASIDQVFNGFGYIGSTVFALPGVEGLIPNGRNTDSSLNNTKFTTNSVLLFSPTTGTYNVLLTLTAHRFFWNSSARYDQENNYNLNDVGIMPQLILGYANFISGRITSFSPKPCFHAVDYYDFKQLDENVVHKTGNESIDGTKTFLQRITYITPNINTNVIPSSNIYNDYLITLDKTANNQIGYFGNSQYTNGNILSRIGTSRRKEDGSYIHTEIAIGTTTDGLIFTNTPTPDLSSNDSNIVNTRWFNQKIQVVSTLPASPNANVYYFVTSA